jgi:hypothetical protein
MLKFANISGFNAREDYWRDKEIHWNERASLTGGSCSISSESPQMSGAAKRTALISPAWSRDATRSFM